MSSDFADLARDRKLLQDFCRLHVGSVLAFKSEGPSFKLNPNEQALSAGLHHLTTTSTCVESILDCPAEFLPKDVQVTDALGLEFAQLAINRHPDEWKSEDSAKIYCKCRALPFVIRHLGSYDQRLRIHLETITSQLSKEGRFAIGEADPELPSEKYWYPPNAFHTYWFLSILKELRAKPWVEFAELAEFLLLNYREEQMLLWAKAIAGRQIALHVSNSSTLDSDQLAWSLAILTRFGSDFQSNLADQDFLRQGFDALFAQQTPAGIWHHGRPLFHYKEAGNAYCYVYETFTVLLNTVLERKNEGEFLRSTLTPFLPKLIKLWKYALTTQIPLSGDDDARLDAKRIGWSSGHRLDHVSAESWATASVFSYAQALRRLLGVCTRESAASKLRQVRTFISTDAADEAIIERGATWIHSAINGTGVAEELMTLFVNPSRRVGSHESMEPDAQPIAIKQARSAILFGPPGTSKTHLARAVAGAIGWRYVELHASHFVAEGLPHVQRTADDIFDKLMELDHTVILFDEIDELVRERDVEPDAFGRFLTTSMLPKLAELWEQRKVIYFIATNHIEYFDRAVTRAQRFDALIFVAPPAFDKKIEQLEKLVKVERPGIVVRRALTQESVDGALDTFQCSSQYSSDAQIATDQMLAKFILLRWDQLVELAVLLLRNLALGSTELVLDAETLGRALGYVLDSSLRIQKTYCDFQKAANYSTRDFGKDVVWEVVNLPASERYAEPLEVRNSKVWLPTRDPENTIVGALKFSVQSAGKVLANDV